MRAEFRSLGRCLDKTLIPAHFFGNGSETAHGGLL